jgi:antitoxin VapB
MATEHIVRLFHNGTNQALNIPQEFELSTDEVVIRKEGDRLIIEPIKRASLLALLATLQDSEDEFPDVDAELLPLDDIQLQRCATPPNSIQTSSLEQRRTFLKKTLTERRQILSQQAENLLHHYQPTDE